MEMINNNLNQLERNTKIKAQALIDLAQQEWLDVYVFEWLRSQERQFELFGRGRWAISLKRARVPVKYANPKAKKVTRTVQSKHIEWKAVDIVFDTNKDPKVRRPSWNGKYSALIYLAQFIWLRNLAPLETCHFEHNDVSIESVLENNSNLWKKSINQEEKDFLHNVNKTIRKYL